MLTGARCGVCKLHAVGDWKPDALSHELKSQDSKHATSHEQGNHALVSLVADTYGKMADDLVRFMWMVANAGWTNCGLSQAPAAAYFYVFFWKRLVIFCHDPDQSLGHGHGVSLSRPLKRLVIKTCRQCP
jgi:hypothetical protein